MRWVAPTLLAAALLATGFPPTAAGAKRPAADPAVPAWVEVTLETIAFHRTNPPRAARGLALVGVAMAEAADQARHSRQAAVAGAAAVVLAYLYPDEAARFEALAHAYGSPLGRRIGIRLVERGRHDGSDAVWAGTIPVGPGLWTPTPPAFAAPLEPLAGTWRPWHLRSGSQLRPPEPPRPGSAEYAAELRRGVRRLPLADERTAQDCRLLGRRRRNGDASLGTGTGSRSSSCAPKASPPGAPHTFSRR